VVRKIERFCVLQFKRNPNDAGLQPLYTFEQVLKDGIYKYLTRDTANVCLSGDWSPGGENEVALMLGL
jgi:hypothetical protein